jgi:hypothetical protein
MVSGLMVWTSSKKNLPQFSNLTINPFIHTSAHQSDLNLLLYGLDTIRRKYQ